MDLSGLNSFAILLWKNFTVKRRRFIALAVEIMLTLLFSGVLLMTRNLIDTEDSGPLRYSALPISDVPEFLRSPNLFHSPWELAYLPARSVVVKKIIERVKYDLDIDFKVQGFSSQSDFEEHLKYENYSKKVLAAVAFDHDFKDSHDPLPLQVKYYLRFSCFQRNDTFPGRFYVKSWSTDFLFPPDPSLEPRAAEDPTGGQPGYIPEGFLLLQHAVDKAIMLYHSNQAAEQLFRAVSVFVQRFPYPIYHRDFFFNFFGIFMPLIILFMFSMNHFTLIQSIVWEKENRLKVHPVPILQHSDPSLIFIFLLCFAIASIFFSFMVSTFFNKAFYAVFFGGFLYFVSYFPYTIISRRYARVTFTQKLASCLCSTTAMALGTQFLVRAEANHIGIKWSNILSSTKTDNFVFAYVLGMLLFDAFLYGLVTWYIEAVFPGEYGVPKPWNFFLLHSYWSGQRTEKNTGNIPFYESVQSQYFETEPSDLVPGIQIKHLCKVSILLPVGRRTLMDMTSQGTWSISEKTWACVPSRTCCLIT